MSAAFQYNMKRRAFFRPFQSAGHRIGAKTIASRVTPSALLKAHLRRAFKDYPIRELRSAFTYQTYQKESLAILNILNTPGPGQDMRSLLWISTSLEPVIREYQGSQWVVLLL